MKTYSFQVVVEPDEDAQGNPAWHAYRPPLESVGGATSSRTREEALIAALTRDGFSFVRQTGLGGA